VLKHGEICPDDGPVCITSVPVPSIVWHEDPPVDGIIVRLTGNGVYKWAFFRIGFTYYIDIRVYCEDNVLKEEVISSVVDIDDTVEWILAIVGAIIGFFTAGIGYGVIGAVVGVVAAIVGTEVAEDVASGQAGGEFIGKSFFDTLGIGALEVKSKEFCFILDIVDLGQLFVKGFNP
jgi:hypothetical protein